MYDNRRLKIDYLRKFKAEFKKALARESGAQRRLFYEKNQMLKIS
jgi:hypothetical protein